MYTGTLIQELLATVERAEQDVQRMEHVSEVRELQRLFELQIPSRHGDEIFAGAA